MLDYISTISKYLIYNKICVVLQYFMSCFVSIEIFEVSQYEKDALNFTLLSVIDKVFETEYT